MSESEIIILEKKYIPEDYLDLRKSLNWELYSHQDTQNGLQNSLYCISVYYQDYIIGMGRVIGDGKLSFYIQDIMVRPEYQLQGIGSLVMKHIMNYINRNAVSNAYIGLMSKIGKSRFYEKFGFVQRPSNSMGPGMVIPNFIPNKNLPSR